MRASVACTAVGRGQDVAECRRDRDAGASKSFPIQPYQMASTPRAPMPTLDDAVSCPALSLALQSPHRLPPPSHPASAELEPLCHGAALPCLACMSSPSIATSLARSSQSAMV
jgi:hypothetical protein